MCSIVGFPLSGLLLLLPLLILLIFMPLLPICALLSLGHGGELLLRHLRVWLLRRLRIVGLLCHRLRVFISDSLL